MGQEVKVLTHRKLEGPLERLPSVLAKVSTPRKEWLATMTKVCREREPQNGYHET